MNKQSIIFLLLIPLFSCERKSVTNHSDIFITGTWIQSGNEENILVMKRASQLDEHKYGFIFFADGKFVERKNAGWCGTPPISYANYDGTWARESDELIDITVGYWGGEISYKMKIISLTINTLRLETFTSR